MKRIFLYFFLATYLNCYSQENKDNYDSIRISKIRITDLKDSISKTKYTLLSFNATWCKPCIDHLNDLIFLENGYSDKLEVFYIWDNQFNPKILQKFTQIHKIYVLSSEKYNKSIMANFKMITKEFNNLFGTRVKLIGPGTAIFLDNNGKVVLLPGLSKEIEEVKSYLKEPSRK